MVKEQVKAIRILYSNTYTYKHETYRIYAINRRGRLLNFHHFQQVKYVYFATKQ